MGEISLFQDMDRLGARSVFYIMACILDRQAQYQICILTVTPLEITIQTVKHDTLFSVWFMLDTGNFLKQSSPDVHSVEDFSFRSDTHEISAVSHIM